MTKREAAELNVKYEGKCYDPYKALECGECPFLNNGCVAGNNNYSSCLKFCKQWLKDNPEEAWEEVDISGYEYFTSSDKNGNITELRRKKRQPKAPTHEEIMTLWWKFETGWFHINWYDIHGIYRLSNDSGWTKNTFIGRESAVIPPESV